MLNLNLEPNLTEKAGIQIVICLPPMCNCPHSKNTALQSGIAGIKVNFIDISMCFLGAIIKGRFMIWLKLCPYS